LDGKKNYNFVQSSPVGTVVQMICGPYMVYVRQFRHTTAQHTPVPPRGAPGQNSLRS